MAVSTTLFILGRSQRGQLMYAKSLHIERNYRKLSGRGSESAMKAVGVVYKIFTVCTYRVCLVNRLA